MEKTQAVLTIDVGSSSVRVSLYDIKQNPLCYQCEKHFADALLDVEEYWSGIEKMIISLTADHPEYEIVGACTSALLSWVFIDSSGTPLTKAFTWMDKKPEQQAAFLEKMTADEFFSRNGRRISPELAGLKLRALKDDSQLLYEHTAFLLSVKDYINYKLTGSVGMDYTTACYTMLLNVNKLAWDKKIAECLEIDFHKLPQLYKSSEIIGRISEKTSLRLGLKEGTPVAAGGPDGSVGVLGAGGVKAGESVSVIGTSDVFFAVSKKFALDSTESLCTNPHVIPGYWLIGGPTGLCGGTLDWIAEEFSEGNLSLKQLDELSESIEEGSVGLFFVPGLTGERTPFWNPDIRGTVCGLSMQHKIQHLFRAVMESNGYTTLHMLKILEGMGIAVNRILAIGGGAKSSLWLKIKANITGKPVAVPENFEATARGCAILAVMAADPDFDIEESLNALRNTVQPDENIGKKYGEFYRQYVKLIKLCSEFYSDDIG